MSLSGGGELRRAVIDDELDTGGTTADQRQLQADEDREIVALSFGKNSVNGFLELSFSSAPEIGGSSNQTASRSQALAIMGGSQAFLDGMDVMWGEGEEVHVHERNNTGATINYGLVIYYREL